MGGKKGKKKKIIDDIVKAPSKRNSITMVGLAAGLMFGLGYFAGVHHPRQEVEKPAPVIEIVQPVESLEDVLKKTMVIEQVKPGSSGNLFLVGMVHYHKVKDKGNQLYVNISPKLADVQSEIYQLLMDLHDKKNLKLIIGEGLGRGNEDRELRFDYPKLG